MSGWEPLGWARRPSAPRGIPRRRRPRAQATAGRLGHDGLLRGTVFGPGQVLLHQISISYLLGDAGQAIEHARRIDTAALPTTERQARYWIDVARAFDQ